MAWIGKGEAHLEIGDPDEALLCCGKVLAEKPDFPFAWCIKARTEESMELTSEAIASYRQYINLSQPFDKLNPIQLEDLEKAQQKLRKLKEQIVDE